MSANELRDRQSRQRDTLAEWFRDLQAPLRRFIARRQGVKPADLDDVAQEVFLRLLRSDRGDLVVDPRSYLFKVAANVAWEWSMRAQQRHPHSAGWLDELADDADVVDAAARAQRHAELDAALALLPVRTTEVLRLHFHEGLTREAIAQHLNVTERIVKREIVKGLESLRVRLGARCNFAAGVTSTASAAVNP